MDLSYADRRAIYARVDELSAAFLETKDPEGRDELTAVLADTLEPFIEWYSQFDDVIPLESDDEKREVHRLFGNMQAMRLEVEWDSEVDDGEGPQPEGR